MGKEKNEKEKQMGLTLEGGHFESRPERLLQSGVFLRTPLRWAVKGYGVAQRCVLMATPAELIQILRVITPRAPVEQNA